MKGGIEAYENRIIYIDTTGLWSLNPLLQRRDYSDSHSLYLLAQTVDALTDPKAVSYCLLPNEAETPRPYPDMLKPLQHVNLLNSPTTVIPDICPVAPSRSAFEEFVVQLQFNDGHYQRFWGLHNHTSVRGGWSDLDKDEQLWDFLNGDVDDLLDRALDRSTFTDIVDLKNLYSIVYRGRQYEFLSSNLREGKAEYFTHPIRWQNTPLRVAKSRGAPLVGLAIVGCVVACVKGGHLDAIGEALGGKGDSAMALARMMLRMRENREKTKTFSYPTSAVEAEEFVMSVVVPGVFPGTIKDRYRDAVNNMITSLARRAALMAVLQDDPTRAAYTMMLADHLKAPVNTLMNKPMPATITGVMRRFVDFSLVAIGHEPVCCVCGSTRRRDGICEPCRDMGRPEGNSTELLLRA